MFIACFRRPRVMAHLQMKAHAPSSHINTQKGAVVKRICCYTATAVRATTMSLPQPAKKRNPRAWHAEPCGRVESVFV